MFRLYRSYELNLGLVISSAQVQIGSPQVAEQRDLRLLFFLLKSLLCF